MRGLPTGTVTFLFTDIEGSTDLLQHLGDRRYQDLLETYRGVLRAVFENRGGTQVDERGEEFFFVFQRAKEAVTAAVEAQRRVTALTSPEAPSIRYRIALHTGEPISTGTLYVGIDVHRAARICAAGHGGQILLSQTTTDLVRSELPPQTEIRELGEHRLKDLQRPERLYQVIVPDLPSVFPPLRSLSVVSNNLPIQLTSFVGRQQEIAEIKQFLSEHRLVTLTGIGGGGKTRLALQVAADLIEVFPHGVWLVDFGSVSSAELVIPTVASTLRVREQAGQSIFDTLTDDLRDKTILLMFDNCEHLIDACAGVAYELVRRSPKLSVLATSREPLRVTGERVYPVPPLALPDLASLPSAAQLPAIEAVQLFVDRAALGQHQFVVTERNAPTVSQIVARLDGIPLAIELAAGLTRVLSVTEIAERLEDRFRVLIGRSRTTVARHQTLEAAMDWSYDLLSPAEQLLLRRLSVFRGGCTLEACQAICMDPNTSPHGPIDLLLSLVEKSLVTHDPDTGRYRVLDTVRQYGEQKLRSADEYDMIHDRLLHYFVAFAEAGEPKVRSPEQQHWLVRLDQEHDNLRAALRRSTTTPGQGEAAVRLAAALWWFWHIRGHWSEGRAWLETSLESGRDAPDRARGRAISGAAFLAWRLDDVARAAALSEESVEVCRRAEDSWGLAAALDTLALVARRRDRYAEAERLHTESLVLFRNLGQSWGVVRALNYLAIVAWYRGDLPRARRLAEESLHVARASALQGGMAASQHTLGRIAASEGEDAEAARLIQDGLDYFSAVGDREGIASSLYMLGRIAARRGEFAAADAAIEQSRKITDDIDDRSLMAMVLSAQGYVAMKRGEAHRAGSCFAESLRYRLVHNLLWDRWQIAESLDGLASVASASEGFERAATLFGAAAGVREPIGARRAPEEDAEYERAVSAVRSALRQDVFDAAWNRGREMNVLEAVDYALPE